MTDRRPRACAPSAAEFAEPTLFPFRPLPLPVPLACAPAAVVAQLAHELVHELAGRPHEEADPSERQQQAARQER